MSSLSRVDSLRAARTRRIRRRVLAVAILAAIVAAIYALSLMWGETFYGPADVWTVLRGETVPAASFAVGELRLPRATLGLLAGLAYGGAGVVFQTMLRNQLASPDIIGINAGASVAGVVGIVLFHMGQVSVSFLALAGALATALAIYLLSYRGGFAGTRLILVGIGVSSMLGSVVTYVLSKASSWDMQTASRWLTGSLNSATWETVAPLAVTCALMLPALLVMSRHLNAMRLGDDSAIALGVRVGPVRVATIVCAVTLVAVATASCGPIAFVAFMSGPIAVRTVGAGASLVLPSALIGAILVLSSDFIGQWAFGTRYPVGVITGILGAPYLIYLLVRSNRSGASL